MTLHQELQSLLNKHSLENPSNTPDFILATFLLGCLQAFNGAVQDRTRWYGYTVRPGEECQRGK